MLRRCLGVLFLSLFLGSALGAGNLSPNAPVENFKLSNFDQLGEKIWDLKGRRGLMIDEATVDIEGMHMSTYGVDEDAMIIESTQARVYPIRNEAQGDDYLLVTGTNYSVLGKNWTWNGNDKTIQIRENSRVTFNQGLSHLLATSEDICELPQNNDA